MKDWRLLATRVTLKGWELVLRAATWYVRLGEGDATTILLDNYTPAQHAAEAALRAAQLQPEPPPVATRVLAVIPFRDRWVLTETALRSLLAQSLGAIKLRVVLVDNGSAEPATADGLKRALAGPFPPLVEVVSLRVDEPFNFSRLNNLAVAAHQDFAPDHVLFLNNDIEWGAPGDLAALVGFANTCPGLGAAGCTLVYPDGRIQHLFVAPGVKIVAAHPLKGQRLAKDGAWFRRPRPVGAVTGAVMLVPARAFAKAGGFDEELPEVGQDVDLCLALQKQGLECWVVPWVRAVHHEGASRGKAIDRRQVARLYEKWGEALTDNPYYSRRFSRWAEPPLYRLGEGLYPWHKVLRG